MIKKLISILMALCMVLSTVPAYALDEETTPETLNLAVKAYDKNSITLKWDDISDDKYTVYKYVDGQYTECGKTDGNEYRVRGLKPGLRYRLAVGTEDLRESIQACAKPETVTLVKGKRKQGKKAYVSWSSSGKYTGFEVIYSPKKNFSEYKTAIAKEENIYLKSLKRDTVYYVKVRAYSLAGDKKFYGNMSQTASFKYNEMYKKDGFFYIDGHLIANKTYSVPANYNPGLRKSAKSAFNNMKKAAAKKGINLWIASGARSYTTQKYIYGNYSAMWGSSVADVFSARPGHSEHQIGLAMDLNIVKDWFANTKESKWLAANCWKYGFIIRYPKNKSDETGYKYEPWHVRYVGKELAKKLYNNGNWITMEHYYNITSRYK